MSFFRRRTFWEKITGEEKTPIEKFESGLESGLIGLIEVITFIIILGFILLEFFPFLVPVLEVLGNILTIFSFIFG